jgi:shikimate dehydrogenase
MADKHLAVVGSPISHSKSPAIHTAAYRVLKNDWDYTAIEIQRDGLHPWLDSLDSNWIGVSVTAPLKEEAAVFAATDLEKTLGSANTLVRATGQWLAYNTDVFGIRQALLHAKLGEIRSVAIIGAGATAKSAMAAVASEYPSAKLTLAARRAEALPKLANFALHAFKFEAKTTTNIAKALAGSDLVISTLPAGALDAYALKAGKSIFGKPRGALFDVAYEPWPSVAARLWSDRSLPVISGMEMLLWQAIAQIRLFSGNPLDLELFNEAAVVHAMRDSVGLL